MASGGPSDDAEPAAGSAAPRPSFWDAGPGNPRLVPTRPLRVVEAAVAAAEAQRAELEAMMARSGQGDALLVAPVEAIVGPTSEGHTSTTWIEGRICVLARVDVLVLFGQPRFVGADPVITRVRWDVAARVCGADCWNPLAGVQPPRVVTRRWPSEAQLEVLTDLSIVEPAGPW
ncbi:hypothetical protein ACE2AJ_01990 [Aquihabitans daechungensis]|uniref:hypothetical protein n=1 Tax=Aquihabitans daechungensis TaxID=1052257 RepID=UPI003BA1E1F0